MPYPTFTCLRQTLIPSLNVTVEEYRHTTTGARHLHLSAEDDNNAFLIAFLTLPQDSTGVAHVLEHTVLCGSERYPIRDPFFMMTRRSLNTFMNAITGGDWTVYPFASQCAKDFDNLLKVYLDAVFFPCLNELDFAQEGHRVEFNRPDDPQTSLVYKGVVFNEMKGAMSSPVQCLWETVQSHVFPTLTYHYNSGGDPREIPNLTYQQLKAFHARHYHPSNAVFMTYGDRPAAIHQASFETYALQYFTASAPSLTIPDEQRYQQPLAVTVPYAADSHGDLRDKTHIVLAWLLDKTTDAQTVMTARLLNGILLDNSASPLRHALETTPLGTAPSPLCGLSKSPREAMFCCGLEGSNLEQVEAVEALILEVLEKVACEGVSPDAVEAILHQMELNQREITSNGAPYGLRLLLKIISPALHGGDILSFLDIDPALTRLRHDCQRADFIPNLVKTWLLENPHRVRVTMFPDATLAARHIQQEEARLSELKAGLDETAITRILTQTKALTARQQTRDNPEILPKVGLGDIPADLKIPDSTSRSVANRPATWFAQGTNGMIYQSIVLDLPGFDSQLLDLLPLFCSCLTEVGCGDKDYLETAQWQTAVSGGISAHVSVRSTLNDVQTVQGFFVLSGKSLSRYQSNLTELLQTTLQKARFDELPRLRDLIAQIRAEADNSITERGSHLVALACISGMSPSGALSNRWYGLNGLQALRHLDDSLETEDALETFASRLAAIRDILLKASRQFVIVSEAASQDMIADSLEKYWQEKHAEDSTSLPAFKLVPLSHTVKQAWSTTTQVNFCAKAYPTVAVGHRDSAALTVLGDFLRNGYLHTAIREKGGAYGSEASYESNSGAFRFDSFRDPRLSDTLTDFDCALEWLQKTRHPVSSLEEAILNVISRIDHPSSPAGNALNTFFATLHGRTPEQRRIFRQRILKVSLDDLQRVALTYLQPERASIAVLGSPDSVAHLPTTLGLEQQTL